VPEGDTVWRTARRLDQALSGHLLVESDFRVPRYANVDLVGQEVLETVSRGKHLLTRLPEITIHTHLKMEGSWHLYRPASPWRSPAYQARLVLANEEWRAVGFRLGVVDVVMRNQEHQLVGHLGPDLLGPDWSLEEAVRRLQADPDRPVGEALLDQRNLAGVGNLYKNEVCFLFGIHPALPIGDVPQLAALVARTRDLIAANKDRAEQSTTGDLRRGRRSWVYRRTGQPCRRCGATIEEATLPAASDEARRRDPQATPDQDEARVSTWCPSCQPAPPR
jgi:endonuclease VIII